MKSSVSSNMTEGSIFKILFFYSLPIIVTNLVQLLFHVVDVTILAIMADDLAVAAVGACGSLITLLVGIFTGFATGSNVLIARRIGEGNTAGIKKATGVSIAIGIISGFILMVIGIVFARKFLIITNCQPDVLDDAARYLVTYFYGMPIIMLYNFVAAVFRAVGDSVRPMKYMIVSGIIKIILNIVFIGVLKISVAGVALATIISNLISLLLALRVVFKYDFKFRVEVKDVCIKKEELLEIIKVGIPTCLCSIFFYIANVILSSKVNLISTNAMTANAISSQFDGIIYNVGCSIAIATSVIVGQNFGAKNFERVRKTIGQSIGYTTCVSLFLGVTFVLLSDVMLGMLSENPDIIAIAKDKMVLLCLTYFITSIMEILSFSLRAMEMSNATMIVGGICGLGIRGLWAWFIWPLHPTLSMLFLSYPVSAFVAIIIYLLICLKINIFKERKYGKSN